MKHSVCTIRHGSAVYRNLDAHDCENCCALLATKMIGWENKKPKAWLVCREFVAFLSVAVKPTLQPTLFYRVAEIVHWLFPCLCSIGIDVLRALVAFEQVCAKATLSLFLTIFVLAAHFILVWHWILFKTFSYIFRTSVCFLSILSSRKQIFACIHPSLLYRCICQKYVFYSMMWKKNIGVEWICCSVWVDWRSFKQWCTSFQRLSYTDTRKCTQKRHTWNLTER